MVGTRVTQPQRRAAPQQLMLEERERAAAERTEPRDPGAEVTRGAKLKIEPRAAKRRLVAMQLVIARGAFSDCRDDRIGGKDA